VKLLLGLSKYCLLS